MPHEELRPSGYDEEERYFYEKDRELIRRKRAELDAARRKREQEVCRAVYWMKCPKCGGDLKEEEMEGVKIDRCTNCGGIYLDKGELELMLQSKRSWTRKLLGL